MKNRKFLVPLAVTVAALSVPGVSESSVSSIAPTEPIEMNYVDNSFKGSITLESDFLILRSDTTEIQTAYHRSHMSHRSHSSHQSHYSSYPR
jgi:hypothetical protein